MLNQQFFMALILLWFIWPNRGLLSALHRVKINRVPFSLLRFQCISDFQEMVLELQFSTGCISLLQSHCKGWRITHIHLAKLLDFVNAECRKLEADRMALYSRLGDVNKNATFIITKSLRCFWNIFSAPSLSCVECEMASVISSYLLS